MRGALKYTILKSVGVPLLLDDFSGSVAALGGRVPQIGPAWSITGLTTGVVAGGGSMGKTSGSNGAYYAVADMAARPLEIGCKFSLSDCYSAFTVGGVFSSGKLLAVQITAPGQPSHTQVNYTTQAGDTDLAGAAASLTAAINANGTLAGLGVVATRTGTQIKIAANGEACFLNYFAESPLTLATNYSDTPTLSSYVTGNNFLLGMLHLRLQPSAHIFLETYASGISDPDGGRTQTVYHGFKANTDYIYRCLIQPPVMSATIYDASGTLIATATASDSRLESLAGASSFWEGSEVGVISYKKAWASRVANQVAA